MCGAAAAATAGSTTTTTDEDELGDVAGLFGCYLRFFQIPSPAEVRRALASHGMGPPGSGLDPDVVVPVLSVSLPGVPAAAILRVAKCGI